MDTAPTRASVASEADPASGREAPAPEIAVEPGFELLIETKPPGIVRRYFTTHRHFLGLLFGGAAALAREWREAAARPASRPGRSAWRR